MTRANLILLLSTFFLLSIVVIQHRSDRAGIESSQHIIKQTNIDSLAIDTIAVKTMETIKKVDSIIKQEKVKDLLIYDAKKNSAESIACVKLKLIELKRTSDEEKKELKERYERHIESIYEENRLLKSRAHDTINTEAR